MVKHVGGFVRDAHHESVSDTIKRHRDTLAKHFDNTFGLDNLAEALFTTQTLAGFPQFNVYANDFDQVTKFVVEIALAGFSKEDLKVSLEKFNDSQKLKIEGSPRSPNPYLSEGYNVTMTQNIAGRGFTREFILGSSVVVNNIKMENGMLVIYLEKTKMVEQTKYLEIN